MSISSGELCEFEEDFIGQLIRTYIIIDLLGTGAFGNVYVCFSINELKFRAIKICPLTSDCERDEAKKEIKIIKKLNSKYITKIYDNFNFTSNNIKYSCIVMKLLGSTLNDLVKQNPNGLPIQFINKVMIQIIDIVKLIHKHKLIYTDFKPDNFLLKGYNTKINTIINKFKTTHLYNLINKNNKNYKKIYTSHKHEIIITDENDDENTDIYMFERDVLFNEESDDEEINDLNLYIKNPVIYLCDFGSCITEDEYDGHEIQTRYYRAPEVILGLDYDYKCDYWSIGCLLYELLTGKLLFDPQKSLVISTNRHHIQLITEKIGDIPENMINKSKMKNMFYRHDGLLKSINKINKINIYDGIDVSCLSILMNTLKINPTDRLLS